MPTQPETTPEAPAESSSLDTPPPRDDRVHGGDQGQPDPSLAPVTNGKSAMFDVWLAAGGLILLLVVGGVLLSRVRKKTLEKTSPVDETETVMQMIKRLHASGEMSDDEYHATRKKLLSTMARQFKDSGPKPADGGPKHRRSRPVAGEDDAAS